MEKKILVIDNEDQSEELEYLTTQAKKDGLILTCYQFNVGSSRESGLLTNGQIDIDKVVTEYRNRFAGKTFHLVACDWDLDDEKIDGVELLRQLNVRKIFSKMPKILYSGLLDAKLGEKIDDFKNDKITRDNLLRHIKFLINSDIRGYYERGEDRDNNIIAILRKDNLSLDDVLDKTLVEYPEFRLKKGWGRPTFNEKTYSEVLTLIDGNDTLREELKKDIIEQVIAYLTYPINIKGS